MKGKSGVPQVLAAGALWGCTGFFVRQLTNLGFSALEITLLRVGMALLGLLPVVLFSGVGTLKFRLRDGWCFFGTGIVSLLFFNFCYFNAIPLSGMAVAAVLLYTAPAIVAMLSVWLFKERLRPAGVLALVGVTLGCLLVSGVLQPGNATFSPMGVLFGLGAGLGYALYSIFGRYASNRGYSSLTITFYTFLLSFMGSLFLVRPAETISKLTPTAILFVAGIGLCCCLLPYLLYTAGLQRMTNSKAAVVATVEPVVATGISLFVLHEPLSSWQSGLGIVLTLGSILVMSVWGQRQNK